LADGLPSSSTYEQAYFLRGTAEDVRVEVRRRIRDLAPGGGYIAAAVHCIQPDVPPANVVTMCDAVRTFGRYPIEG